jgi:hypothetical protein
VNVPELRKSLLEAKRQLTIVNTAPGDATYLEEEREIPVRDGSSITVRIHSPMNPPQDGGPVFVVYHGGGFALGGLDNETLLCRNFTQLGGVAVNVDYRLSPENPFPVGIHDAYDALKWVQLPNLRSENNTDNCRRRNISKSWVAMPKRASWWEASAPEETSLPWYLIYTSTRSYPRH